MRAIDADHLRRWILSRVFKTQLSVVDVIDQIDREDTIEPEQQWIPCREKLPEKSGQYYVSGGDKVWICEFLIIPNFIGGWCNDVANPVVQAWMQLPEPYIERRKG